MNCRRCKEPLTTWFGTKPEPYCSKCWMVYGLGLSERQAKAIESELDEHRQRGVDESVVKILLHNAARTVERDRVRKCMALRACD